jgi:hypothetical protein
MAEIQTKQKVREILELAIQIEEGAASLYSSLSKRFAHVAGMPAFWHSLCVDELEHAGLLLSVFKSLPGEILNSMAQPEICESINANIDLLDSDLLDPVRNLDDAYELAHFLEFSEINAVFKYLSTQYISGKSRAELISSQIDVHQKKLVDFDEKYGDKNWRRQFEIQPE